MWETAKSRRGQLKSTSFYNSELIVIISFSLFWGPDKLSVPIMNSMTSTSESLVVVLVPGAWNKPSVFDALQSSLHRRGLATMALGHPSNGAEPPNKTLQDDINYLHESLKRLIDEGKYLIVIVHSYGGIVGSGAVAGLSKLEREKQSLPGGVSIIVYMTAFAIPRGMSLKGTMGGEYPDFVSVEARIIPSHFISSSLSISQGDYIHFMGGPDIGFHGVPKEEHVKFLDSFTHICRGAFEGAATYEPRHEIPSAYILCEDDRAIPLPLQEQMAQRLKTKFEYRIKSSHMPFIGMPDTVADIIKELSAHLE